MLVQDATTTQAGLNEVVRNKVNRMIANRKSGVENTMQRLIEEGKIQQDFIAPIGVHQKNADEKPVVSFANNGHVLMQMPDGEFSLHDNAVNQLGEKMGVPSRYLRSLAAGDEWQRALCARILNEHSGWTDRSRVLVRSVGKQVRAVLSDSYRRLNSQQILTSFIEATMNQGGVIADAYMNDTKIWAETILPEPITIPTALNGEVLIFAGARFSTSDYGNGSVDMRAFIMNGICLNGMVRESVMKQVHLGSKLPDNLLLSNRTYELDTQTTVSAIKDLTKGVFGRETIMRKALEIQAAGSTEIDIDRELKQLQSKGHIQKSEKDEVEKLLMQNNPYDGVQGGASLWKLTQAITAHARETTPERSRELQEISGALMDRVKVSEN